MPSAEYVAAMAAVAEAKKAASEVARKAFALESKNIFEKYGIESFSWVQYTPYFNDGDTCYFGVRADAEYDIEINGHNREEVYGYTAYGSDKDPSEVDAAFKLTGETPPPYEAYNEVQNFVYAFDPSDLEEMFGDHVRVIVTPDGGTTEGYSHD